jgi:hypothetical protein
VASGWGSLSVVYHLLDHQQHQQQLGKHAAATGKLGAANLPSLDSVSRAACETGATASTTAGAAAATPAAIASSDSFVSSSPQNLLVQYGDYIYRRGNWDGAPIIVEKYKLVFFTVPKVGCTAFKQLFRRMMGHPDWSVQEYQKWLPWNPSTNGLAYLYNYDPQHATHMMTSPEWTRAVFVREPKARLLSAYLDKAVRKGGKFLSQKGCCPYGGGCVPSARASLRGFLETVVYYCDDTHWRPQSRRMETKYWPLVNFVGRLETMRDDARLLLERIGAWDEFGVSGWGPDGTLSLFAGPSSEAYNNSSSDNIGQKHATGAVDKFRLYYGSSDDPDLAGAVEAFYAEDYSNPYLNLTRTAID